MPLTPTIADLLAAGDRPTMSFEFFPPKDDAGQEQLARAVGELEPLRPDFVSVTYGASGSTRSRTLDATRMITAQAGFRTMGHLTCVSQSRAEVEGAIASYAEAGIRHVLAVRGDPPGGAAAPWQPPPQGRLPGRSRGPQGLRPGRPHPRGEGGRRRLVRDHPAVLLRGLLLPAGRAGSGDRV